MSLSFKLSTTGGMLAAVALMLPWLNPVAGGPTPAVTPWLVSAACLASLCLLVAQCDIRWEATIRDSWLLAALISSVLGLLQYFDLSSALHGWVNNPSPGAAYGNLRQRNQFATLVNMGLIALVCLAVHRHALRDEDGLRRANRPGMLWMAAAAVLLATANAASLSRTGVLQLVGIVVMSVLWSWWKVPVARRILLLALLAYVLASVALPWLAGRDPFAAGIANRFGDAVPSCQSRWVLWSNVLHLIGMRPWTGWGWGELDFAHFMTLYPGTRFCDILDNAHNLPLHLAVELGIPVAALVCGFVAWLIWRARPLQETAVARQMAWAVLALIGLHSMLEYPLWYGPFQLALVSCIWILWRHQARGTAPGPSLVGQPLSEPVPSAVSNRLRWSMTGLGVVIALSTAYAMWDYQRVSQIYLRPEQRMPAYRDDTLAKAQASWLFRRQVRFAELTLAHVEHDNAARLNAMARQVLHFSPEPRVIEKLIDTARLLGHDDEARSLIRRFEVAFPVDHARWALQQEASTAGAPKRR